MKLLLDTHIWLWSISKPSRLAPPLAAVLRDADTELWLSPVSTWELFVLAEKGRVVLNAAPAVWVRRVLREIPFKQAPLNHEVTIQSRVLDLPHRDPADRFLAATAVVYDLTLATADERLLGSTMFATLANR